MASVKIEDVVYHLDSEFKKALDDTMSHFAPNMNYDRNELFRFFLQRVYTLAAFGRRFPMLA